MKNNNLTLGATREAFNSRRLTFCSSGELRGKENAYFQIKVKEWALSTGSIHYEFRYLKSRGYSAEFHIEQWKGFNTRVHDLAVRVREIDGLKVEFSDKWLNGCLMKLSFGHQADPKEMANGMVHFIEQTFPDIDTWLKGGCTTEADVQRGEVKSKGNTVQREKNIILFGPPGTGKTFHTVNESLEILDLDYLNEHKESGIEGRRALKTRFDSLVSENRIRFVTFHQSFSYEDFVEGLRASSDNGQVEYRVEPGVFKQLCDDARDSQSDAATQFSEAVSRMRQICDESESRPVLKTPTGKLFEIEYSGGKTFKALPRETVRPDLANATSLDEVRSLYFGEKREKIGFPSYAKGMLAYLKQHCGLPEAPSSKEANGPQKNFVLIIDEINRGNISRIFGELITLIEPSKRAGADEALEVVLPYSKERFSVPDNVYLIGTMNTADRSLAGLDIALRRRFTFIEMPPKLDLLDDIDVAGINIGQMLRVMNLRIEVLLDRDHCLGHAYFMSLARQDGNTLENLAAIFRQNVLPLLQEYFFEDWQRIHWVLNDQNKAPAHQFVCQHMVGNGQPLFKGVPELQECKAVWRINTSALQFAASFAGIIDASASSTTAQLIAEAQTSDA